MLLGSFTGMIVTAYSHYSWAWRVPFLLSIFTGLIGYFVRKKTPESEQFERALADKTLIKFPLYNGFILYKLEMLRIVGVYILSAMITYIIFIFMPSYAATINNLPLADVTFISTIALAGVTFLVPLGGYLSDLMGINTVLRYSAFGFLLLSYPLFNLIVNGSYVQFVFAEFIFVLLAAGFQGTINIFVVNQLPIAVRYSIMAVGYNIAYSLFGGTAPIIASYIVNITGDKAGPGLYLMFGALTALLATLKREDTPCITTKMPSFE